MTAIILEHVDDKLWMMSCVDCPAAPISSGENLIRIDSTINHSRNYAWLLLHAVTSCEMNIEFTIASLVPPQNDKYHRCLITHGDSMDHELVIVGLQEMDFREPIHD